MIRFAFDALTGFSSAPLKLASHAGLWLSVGSVLVMLYILAGWLSGRAIPGWTSLMLIVVVIGAVQMFVLGLMGEYIGRLYSQAKQRPLYIVQEIAGSGDRRSAAPRARAGDRRLSERSSSGEAKRSSAASAQCWEGSATTSAPQAARPIARPRSC